MKFLISPLAFVGVLTSSVVSGYVLFNPTSRSQSTTVLSSHKEARTHVGRRQFGSHFVAAGVALTSSATFLVQPANAFGGALGKINAQLQGYGLPPLTNVPDGFSPLLQLYGKAANRAPLLVQFVHPFDWVVTVPSIDVNGEEGTIQAGEYAKGDTATLFVYKAAGHVDNIAEKPKSFFEEVLFKALTQKGENLVQEFKITKIEPTKQGKQDYILIDFKYELLTGAGFTVDRKGVASVTSEGDAVEALWSASIAKRYKKTESQLRTITSSFRCYAEGLKFSIPEVKDFS